jgi:hypothetical protein
VISRKMCINYRKQANQVMGPIANVKFNEKKKLLGEFIPNNTYC